MMIGKNLAISTVYVWLRKKESSQWRHGIVGIILAIAVPPFLHIGLEEDCHFQHASPALLAASKTAPASKVWKAPSNLSLTAQLHQSTITQFFSVY
jgi:hypothetical protein